MDIVLFKLCDVIVNGCPGKTEDLPAKLCEYWNFCDELSIENGIIFKGWQVLVPPPSGRAILKQLYASHQNTTLGTGICILDRNEKNICKLCESCSSCQESITRNKKEPLMMHEKPARPWIKIGTDLFSIDTKVFLIISDYFSHYPMHCQRIRWCQSFNSGEVYQESSWNVWDSPWNSKW